MKAASHEQSAQGNMLMKNVGSMLKRSSYPHVLRWRSTKSTYSRLSSSDTGDASASSRMVSMPGTCSNIHISQKKEIWTLASNKP